MVNDIVTTQVMVHAEELELLGGELNDYIRSSLGTELGHFIAKECTDLVEVKPYRHAGTLRPDIAPDSIFRLQLAILTPQRYNELLQKEHRLEKLEW